MNFPISLESCLKAEWDNLGEVLFCERIQSIMRERAKGDLDQYLRRHKLKGHYDRAATWKTGKVKSLTQMAHCLRSMGISVNVETRYPPWNRVKPGSTVVVLVGVRYVSISKVSDLMEQRAVGARDMEALVELMNFLQGPAQTNCQVQLQLIPPKLSPEQAEVRLALLRQNRRDVEAIIVLGSPVANPIADYIAKEILNGDPPTELTAKFRWPFKTTGSLLSESRAYSPDKVGLARTQCNQVFPRILDDQVMQSLHGTGDESFPDCGLLMLDTRRTPMLILAAGHGGCGTKACIRALTNQQHIAELLKESEAEGAVNSRRLCEVITVNRTAPRNPRTDDMEIENCRFAFDNVRIVWP